MSKRIGYWNTECDPHTFIDPTWDPAIRDSVIQRLRIATPFAQWLGYASRTPTTVEAVHWTP